jgi:hypothetical protein
VGAIDTSHEHEFWKHIQALLGLRTTTPRVSDFYLSGSPDSEWVQAARDEPSNQLPFWIAIDPFGEMRARYATDDSTKFFFSTEKAIVVTGLARCPPEPHHGLIVRPVPIAIRLKRSPAGVGADGVGGCHPLAEQLRREPVANCFDGAAHLSAEEEWQSVRIPPGTEVGVDEMHADRLGFDQHLTRAGRDAASRRRSGLPVRRSRRVQWCA